MQQESSEESFSPLFELICAKSIRSQWEFLKWKFYKIIINKLMKKLIKIIVKVNDMKEENRMRDEIKVRSSYHLFYFCMLQILGLRKWLAGRRQERSDVGREIERVFWTLQLIGACSMSCDPPLMLLLNKLTWV